MLTLYVDLTAETLVVSANATTAFGTVRLHQGDRGGIAVWFLQQTGNEATPYEVVPIPDGYTRINLGVRPANDLDESGFLCSVAGGIGVGETWQEVGEDDTLHYEAALFSRATAPINTAFTAAGQAAKTLSALLDIELADDAYEANTTPVKQAAVLITRDIYRGDEGMEDDPNPPYPPVAALLTRTNGIECLLGFTALVGGDPDQLDGIPTVGLTPPLLKALVLDGALRVFLLKAWEEEELDGHNVIEPTDFDPDTNPKLWISVL